MTDQQKTNEDLIEIKEVAKELSRTVRSIVTLREKDSSFPDPVMWGKKNVWKRGDVLAWKAAQFAVVSQKNAEKLAQTKGGAA